MDQADNVRVTLQRNGRRISLLLSDLFHSRVCGLFRLDPASTLLMDEQGLAIFPDGEGNYNNSRRNIQNNEIFTVEGSPSASVPTSTGQTTDGLTFQAQPFFPVPSTSQSPYNTLPRPLRNQMSTSQRPPKQKKDCCSKAILLSEYHEGKLLSTGQKLYVDIEEGKATPEEVAKTVKEYLNSSDDYIIVDVHGYELTDSPGTRALEFWKNSAKKFMAVTVQHYMKYRHDTCNKRKRSSETSTLTQQVTDNLKDAVFDVSTKADIMLDRLTQIDIKLIDVETSFGVELNSSSEQILSEVRETRRVVQELAVRDQLLCSLKEAFTCKICQTAIPQGGLSFAQCCSQLVGCTSCVQRWFDEEETCPLCRCEEGATKIIPFRGFDEILKKLN